MSAIPDNWGTGEGIMVPLGNDNQPTIAQATRDIADDLAELRTKFIAVLAKLDADAGVTDTDYAALHTPAALKTTKV